MRFAALFAWRHLRTGGSQTLLIIGGVAVAVLLVVFVSGLIVGVQRRIMDIIAGSIPHVTVLPAEYAPRVPGVIAGTPHIFGRVESGVERRRDFTNWQPLVRELATFPSVSAVSPELRGQAIASVGAQEVSVSVLGAFPAERDRIVNLRKDIVAGDLDDLVMGKALIGSELGEELGIGIGDRLRLTAASGRSETFRVVAVISTGQQGLDENSVLLTLNSAQGLFAAGRVINSISIHLDDIYAANRVADAVAQALEVKTESWMRQNVSLLNALRAQSASVVMISLFSMAAAGFAIASVLIVSVLKRSREIGILKAMGAHRRQILLIFTLEGVGVALVGSAVGSILGSTLVLLLRRIPVERGPGSLGESLFPGVVLPGMIALTVFVMLLIALLASVLPARQAAQLEPAEVIRYG